MPEALQGYVLAFDYGKRRIGVAVGQALTRSASALETVDHHQQPDWPAIERLVKEWRPSLLLVGLPLGAEGDETDMSREARKFGAALQARFDKPVEYSDERFTSRAAEVRFAEQRAEGNLRRKHGSQLDAMAAQIILENWLQSQP